MNHLTEEQLILHYYGEPGEPGELEESSEGADALATERHLETCSECRGLYGSLQRLLNVVDSLPVPERGPEYGAQLWKRIEHRIPARRRGWFPLPSPWRWATAGAAFAALLVAAFFAGRSYPGANNLANHLPRQPAQMAAASRIRGAEGVRGADSQAGERILLVAVGDYLERSQMVLIELANANPKAAMDISGEQERAGDLVTETRLYRQTAARTGDTQIGGVLDELERVLVDITHAPSNISPRQLQELHKRLEAEGILFKIRVLGSNVRNQDVPVAKTAGRKL